MRSSPIEDALHVGPIMSSNSECYFKIFIGNIKVVSVVGVVVKLPN